MLHHVYNPISTDAVRVESIVYKVTLDMSVCKGGTRVNIVDT